MRLGEILKGIKTETIIGSVDVEITDVNIDSRRVEAGQLFLAIKGTQTDGHKYIGKAVEQGAVAILCEELPEEKVILTNGTDVTEEVVKAESWLIEHSF